MIGVVQTIKSGSVSVDGNIVGKINEGLLLYLCIEKGDDEKKLYTFLDRVISLRVFEDDNNKMNLSLLDTFSSILVISQFTLSANTSKGHRPSFDGAEEKQRAEELYNRALLYLKEKGLYVQSGVFGAKMEVNSINNGPKTFLVKM